MSTTKLARRSKVIAKYAAGAGCMLLAGTLASPALAQDAGGAATGNVTLDEITVTAARAARPVEDIPQTVQVIDRTEIEKQLAISPSAAGALSRLVPGYSASTQTVSSASETFRGRDLLVMMDGVPLNSPLRDVSRILGLIDLNSVERIEVVAGASSLYGAGATGGTVNFITRKGGDGAPKIGVNAAVRAFTANVGPSLAPELSGSLSGKAGGFDYLVIGSGRAAGRTYDGSGRELPSDSMLGQGGGDRFQQGNLLAKLGYDFDASRRFEVSGNLVYFDQNPQWNTLYSAPFARPEFGSPYTGESVLENTQNISARYTDKDFALGSLSILGYYNNIEKRFNFSNFSYPYNSLVYYSFLPSSPTSPNNQTILYSQRGGLNLTIDTPLDMFWQGAKFTWGADLIREKTHQTLTNGQEVFTPLGQTTYAGFGLLQVPVGDRLVLRGGVRYEYFDLNVDNFVRPAAYIGLAARTPLGYQAYVLPALNVTGGNFDYSAPTFNAGATYKLTDRAEIYGGFSQGYALPDVGAFTRRAGLSTAYACSVARPNCLRPGTSVSYASIGPEAQIVNNYEIGIRGSAGPVKASLAGYISTSNEGVTFDPLTNQISQQKERIWGVEFIGEWAVNTNLTLGTNATYRDGRYDSNRDGRLDSALPNNRIASPYRGTLFGAYRFDNGLMIRLEAEAFSGRNERIDLAGTRYEIKPGVTANALVTYPIEQGEFYVAANNLLDATYQNPTATSVRNLPVYSWGRTVTLGFRTSF
ncbi:TonB-dependent receptor [Chelatococcus reniformis]|uniref:Siderophore receptor n=1 Tax=Chelatococcus reniformis TaxID=1494448 RepID=A0A916XFU7_9HYPH|nr:TonB-dependent receptor [Chelatococcus reniformis]GGC70258.1 siderophore receptor [Chelatococcus reniformis]